MTQWNTLLKTLGFTESEAKIYLISLEMGPSSVQDIARKAKVSRVTTYAVIESLTERGLMSSVQKGKKTNYMAETPERLVSFVQTRMREMESTLKEVEAGITDLRLLQRGEKPVVKIYEGPEGIKAILDDITSSIDDKKSVIMEVGNVDSIKNIFPGLEGLKPWRTELARRNIPSRGIFLSKEGYTPRPGANVRILPKEKFNFTGDVTIYKNKVALYTFKGKLVSVLIESEEIAETLRQLYEMAWQGQSATNGK
ncbi:MAG: helix-turn-helix domain-containing protein [Patescibacteria group bacterium]